MDCQKKGQSSKILRQSEHGSYAAAERILARKVVHYSVKKLRKKPMLRKKIIQNIVTKTGLKGTLIENYFKLFAACVLLGTEYPITLPAIPRKKVA